MSIVSISRCTDVENINSLKKSLSNSIGLLGGFKSKILKGDSVLIKPNIVAPMSFKTGAVTNPYLIEALIDLLQEEGIKKITIGEGSAVGIKTNKSFSENGWDKIAERKKIDLVDFKKEKFIPMSIPNGKILKFIHAPKILLETDIIINVPVMKTHDTYPATIGLKNMKGVIREKDKKRFHLWGLSQCIVDLNKLVLPHITIEDGTIGMEGYGPMFGTPANLGAIVTSFDTVAADYVASKVMGIEPDTIEYLKLAIQQGLAFDDISNIEILGLHLKEVKKKFSRATLEEKELKKHNIKILEGGACSGCKITLEAYLYRMQKDGLFSNIKDHTFILGQNVKVPKDLKGPIVKFGACTKATKAKTLSQEIMYVQGCPPHPHMTDQYIESGKLY